MRLSLSYNIGHEFNCLSRVDTDKSIILIVEYLNFFLCITVLLLKKKKVIQYTLYFITVFVIKLFLLRKHNINAYIFFTLKKIIRLTVVL